MNERCLLWYEFDKNLNLRNVYADDQFRNAHNAFYRGSGGHILTPQEEQAFWKVRCLVGCGTEFVQVARVPANTTRN